MLLRRSVLAAGLLWACAARVGGDEPAATDAAREGYARRAAALAQDDARGRFSLARWCQQNGLVEEARRECWLVLQINPRYPQARELLDRLGGPPADAPPEGGAGGAVTTVPRAEGNHLVEGRSTATSDGKPVQYWLRVPREAAGGGPLPLAMVHSWLCEIGKGSEEIAAWSSFPGFVAAPVNVTGATGHADMEAVLEILDDIDAVHDVDRDHILVTDWRTRRGPTYFLARPDLFRFVYANSILGHVDTCPWPPVPAGLTDEQRAQYGRAHVFMKLTGQDYKPEDLGYDDEAMATVRRFFEGLGVTDLTLDRYPRGKSLPAPDYTCICGAAEASAGAQRWFRERLEIDRRAGEVRAEYDRRRGSVRADSANAWLQLARWCEQQGFRDEAREAYGKALELEPGNPRATRGLEALGE